MDQMSAYEKTPVLASFDNGMKKIQNAVKESLDYGEIRKVLMKLDLHQITVDDAVYLIKNFLQKTIEKNR